MSTVLQYAQSVASLTDTMLSGVGMLAFADVDTAARKTCLSGDASLLDALLICAGQQKDYKAPRLSSGEYPACAAMTSGYVFRVENEATVHYLQRVGRTGQLTTLQVTGPSGSPVGLTWPSRIHLTCATLTVVTMARMAHITDWIGLTALLINILARYINTLLIRRQSVLGWQGESEPHVKSDIFVLLSQDRWIRMQGLVDDMKAAISGSWLRQPTLVESLMTTLTTMLVYLNAGIVAGVSVEGKVLLLILICSTTALLEVANHLVDFLTIHGRTIRIVGERQEFKRRLHLAEKLIEEVGRRDWCENMGMIPRTDASKIGISPAAAHM